MNSVDLKSVTDYTSRIVLLTKHAKVSILNQIMNNTRVAYLTYPETRYETRQDKVPMRASKV